MDRVEAEGIGGETDGCVTTDRNGISLSSGVKASFVLRSEASAERNLTSSAGGGEYSADVARGFNPHNSTHKKRDVLHDCAAFGSHPGILEPVVKLIRPALSPKHSKRQCESVPGNALVSAGLATSGPHP